MTDRRLPTNVARAATSGTSTTTACTGGWHSSGMLPPALAAALATELRDVPPRRLTGAADRLSRRYREDRPAPDPLLDQADAVAAYLATRVPATFAAVHAAAEQLALAVPDLTPRRLLDLGAGLGAATWALHEVFASVGSVHLVDYSAVALATAGRMLGSEPVFVTQEVRRLDRAPAPGERHDVAVVAYVLGELAPADRHHVVDRLVAAADTVLVVEAGTPAGYQRVLAVRDRLVADGWRIAAPCPHEAACPLAADDWCHFGARLARSATHRAAKGAERSFEDEPFSYLAATRRPVPVRPARVLRRPRVRSGHVLLTLCEPAGRAEVRTVSARDKAAYRKVRRVAWGDVWPT